jgi:hypothetical protein
MKKTVLFIALMSIYATSFSQEIKTLFNNDSTKTKSVGGYGGPFINATQMNNDWGVMLGGKGGVVFNRNFAFGGVGMAMVSNATFTGDDLNGNKNTPLELSYGVGGLFFEYIFKLDKPIHFSVPLNVLAGGVTVSENEVEIESSAIFVLEPGINVEFNFSEHFIPGITFSYRQVFGASLTNISNQDISGINIGLMLKFGAF